MKHQLTKRAAEMRDVRVEGFLPLLLATVCMLICLLVTLIDKLIYPFHSGLLAPALCQILILLIPAYLCTILLSPEKKPTQQLRHIGIASLRAEYIFFLIFTAMFTVTGAQLLNMLFRGTKAAAEGFTLFAAFTAGNGEYATNYTYLILVYAIFPSIIEEAVFRGVIYHELQKINRFTAIALSSLISAAFSFTLGGLPAALFCAVIYCFVLLTTGSLQACILVHLVYNLYALLLGTNVSAYFHSSQNNLLLVVICIGAWLVSTALFCAESARIYRTKAANVLVGGEVSAIPSSSWRSVGSALKSTFGFRPTLVCAIVFLFLYAATMLVCALI